MNESLNYGVNWTQTDAMLIFTFKAFCFRCVERVAPLSYNE